MTEPLFTLDAEDAPSPRPHAPRKRHGVHYTPPDLAGFVARRALEHVEDGECVVLDPACGEGELLLAVADETRKRGLPAPHLIGIDRDADAVRTAERRLGACRASGVILTVGDFLSIGAGEDHSLPKSYDLVISNPPYVRTQVLGAARAQELGRQFGLKGRVDLYHAFAAAMTRRLRQGGVLGLLCSNRFMTTRGGRSLRTLLASHYVIEELWDLGDTKLFEAAVLPAVVVARRSANPSSSSARFTRVYEDEQGGPEASERASLLEALESNVEGAVSVAGRSFKIERGKLAEQTPDRPWRLTSATASGWLRAVERRSAGRFGDIGAIRVGIKTTADSVFIRASWSDLPSAITPEPELIHPLLTHRVAARWRADDNPLRRRSVLYPHESRNGRRQTVDLTRFPKAAAYLEHHRLRLESRTYVIKAGRAWHEIWVPQQPSAWEAPKLVWPDISDRPRFFLDRSGAIVNGDCYWLSCADLPAPQLALALAVANSTFATEYYDMFCGNRLYAGRRRFITQYLEALPIPEASQAALRDVEEMVAKLQDTDEAEEPPARLTEAALDSAVFELFGLKEVAR